MRSDYALYVVAIICFIVAIYTAFINTEVQLYVSVLAVVGIIFIGLGYMARPKNATLAPAMPAPSVSVPESPSKTVKPKTEPKKETKKTTTKKRARKKKTTRRRKKKA